MCSRMNLHVGVLHYTPSCEPFPLLADPVHYEPNTLDMGVDNAFPVDQYRHALQPLPPVRTFHVVMYECTQSARKQQLQTHHLPAACLQHNHAWACFLGCLVPATAFGAC